MKLLFFSLRLIFATTQPSRQDSSSTKIDTKSRSSTQPATAAAVSLAVKKYTTTAGSSTTPENISPIR